METQLCQATQGQSYTFGRQEMVVIDGDGGPVLLVYSARVSKWDEAAIESLLASIQ